MCHEPTARPPLPPIAGGAGTAGSGELVLEAADGNRFLAHSALTARPVASGVVILPDVRGLHPFYKDLAERFAAAGVHATAIDYFGRTAGTGERDADFDFRAHIEQTEPDAIARDVAAAVAHVRSPAGGNAPAVFTVGFCFGGRKSFNQAGREHDLDGVIGFYGRPQQDDEADDEAPILLAPSYRCPVLGLFGGGDRSIPADAVEVFRATLDEAGVQNEVVVYDGAPHSFFDRSFREHQEACDDAWRRVLRFVGAASA